MLRLTPCLPLLAGITFLPPLAPRAEAYRTDTNHSTVGFSVPILGGISEVTAKFSRFSLDFQYDPEKPEESRVLAVIEAASIDTGIDERDAHLRSGDFLAVEEYPEITFESFEVLPVGERLEVIGVLTIRDVSQDVVLDVQVLEEAEGGRSVGFLATTTFDRQEFGVAYKHRDIPNFIGDEIRVRLHLLTSPARR
jgi:polyisoprenoid-binding protein YceI